MPGAGGGKGGRRADFCIYEILITGPIVAYVECTRRARVAVCRIARSNEEILVFVRNCCQLFLRMTGNNPQGQFWREKSYEII